MPKLAALSFVGTDASGDYPKVVPWQPKRSGDYGRDCAAGRSYYVELHNLMLLENNPTFLARVISAQVAGGVWEGVEIGFTQAMAERLLAAEAKAQSLAA
ncbi:hypothetical protein EN780_03485 [Mesorhizobium sp. M4B.F.Ca.ET.089.01.1.1]|uniref:hypothetical protein n=1 Tax=Mesorhizobium sp. M4B.F.Ca.ET.089.01.1.1 TaxID=2496662 RepID=UPI000FE2CB61|nr:hypothetical protein [Mesorhizobium sp. M4B.F.Ca.ET.089.01.1.1]RWX70470.1 hypothetical protein EN780_03485 [Mesorhizobium sp. M4B.F.Ca.ET.089.01.1.1]